MLLKDKVAIVTGAATGIGESIARTFAQHGAAVYLLDRDAAGNESAAAAIRASGGDATAIAADVTSTEAVQSAVEAALARSGRIDILINNAGIFPRKAFLEMTEADWDRMQDVNLKSVYRTTKAVLPGMVAKGSGKIVNISSVTFHLGTPLLTHYVASKGGVIGLTRALAREMGPDGIHINCITPGAIQTESEKHFVSEEQEKYFLAEQCLKRRLKPADIANTALFLASALGDGVTGQTINVDGGWYMH